MLVVHLRAGGELERAGKHAVRAADQAAHALAFDRAARLYRLALELRVPRPGEREALEIKRGDALANAGRGQEAAAAYIATAKRAAPDLALDLRRRAGEQLLRNGHIDEGLSMIGQVLDTLGIAHPKTPKGALLSLLWQRTLLSARGLGFQERSESQLSRADLTRIDVCWSSTVVTGMVDTIRGAETQARHLRTALSIGEPYRMCRALCLEAAHVASEGQTCKPRYEEIGRAESLAQRTGHPHATGLTELARGMAAWVFGYWTEPARCRAIRLFASIARARRGNRHREDLRFWWSPRGEIARLGSSPKRTAGARTRSRYWPGQGSPDIDQ
jgi:hypothetical protein